MGPVHPWTPFSSAVAHGAGEPSAASRARSRAFSSRSWSPGCGEGSCSVRSGGSCGTRDRCSDSSTCQSRSVPATSGRPSDAVPTVRRSDCETHRRVGQVARSGVVCKKLAIGCNGCNRKPQPVRQHSTTCWGADANPEVAGMVSQMQRGFAGQVMDGVIQESPTKMRARPECFVSHTVEELFEWMDSPTCV